MCLSFAPAISLRVSYPKDAPQKITNVSLCVVQLLIREKESKTSDWSQ